MLFRCGHMEINLAKKGPAYSPGLHDQLLLLLTLGVGLVRLLVGRLRMLLCRVRMFLALRMVAFAMMFGGRTVCLGRVFVVFSGLVVFISCHVSLVGWFSSQFAPKRRLQICSSWRDRIKHSCTNEQPSLSEDRARRKPIRGSGSFGRQAGSHQFISKSSEVLGTHI